MNNELKAASTLMQQGQLPRAEAMIADLKDRYESIAAVWALASEISLRQGKFRSALDEVNRAVTLDVHNAKRHAQCARCAILAGLVPEANASVARAIDEGVTDPDDFLLLASVLVRCDDHEGALQMYRQAEGIQPDRNELHRGMATVYRFLGQLDNAEASCDKALAIDPHDYEMLNLRSSLRKQSKDSNHVEQLTGLLQSGVKDWRGAVQVSYALAKELEDLEEYDESFKYLSQGASLRRRNTQYDVEDDIKIFAAIQ
ncbi:MAG: tetratricopeptide repeat protein, partial [Gammaproteobacteria bacterium]|nr:tetratricopeptide repeat protein [Gammaproteobacteria bacterium]